ncbi:MAG: hypothetical protein V3S33_08790 [Gammaproteobacteria bacterium]
MTGRLHRDLNHCVRKPSRSKACRETVGSYHPDIATVRGALIGLAALMMLVAEEVPARQWKFTSDLLAGATYRDSSRANADPRSSGWQTGFKPRVSLSRQTGRTSLEAGAEYNFSRFSETDTANADSRAANINSSYRTSRQVWSLNGLIRSTNRFEHDLDETGIVFDNTLRTLKTVQPVWSWSIGRNNRLSVSGVYSDVSYSNAGDTNLRNFTTQSVSTNLSHTISGTSQVFGSVSWSSFEFEDQTSESTTVSGNVGFNHSFSPWLSLSASTGRRSTSSTQRQDVNIGFIIPGFPPIRTGTVTLESDTENTGSVYSGSITRSFSRGLIQASAGRTVSIRGDQGQVIADNASLSGNWRFGPKWTAAVSGRISTTEDIDSIGPTLDRTTTTARFQVTWQPKRDINVSGGIQGVEQKPTNNSTIAETTRLSMNLLVRWDFSRRWRFTAGYRYTDRGSDIKTSEEQISVYGLTLLYTWPKMTFSQ